MSYSIPTCDECGYEYHLRDGCDPSKYCDECAQVRVIELEALIAAAPELLEELRDLCDVASTADLPLRVRDQAHKARLLVSKVEGRE